MKIGNFTVMSDGRVQCETGAELDPCLYRGFLRELHAAHARGEVWTITDSLAQAGLGEARSMAWRHKADALLNILGAPLCPTIPQRLEAVVTLVGNLRADRDRAEKDAIASGEKVAALAKENEELRKDKAILQRHIERRRAEEETDAWVLARQIAELLAARGVSAPPLHIPCPLTPLETKARPTWSRSIP